MKAINHNTLAAAVATLGLAFCAAGAQAAEPGLTVRYADLNVNSPAGAKVLYQRIHNAAEQVCGELDPRQMARSAAVKTCQDRAIEKSVRTVNNVQLSQTAAEHGYPVRIGITVASVR